MPALNWDVFVGLPGSAEFNFEALCRALIRRHYGQFGEFRALANQPGVEFHLKLHSSCSLGDPPRWYGWQCRWYGLPGGRAIGTTRRQKIREAITTTQEILPDLTDWVLWTRHPLTKGDQDWFYALETHMSLHLWTGVEVEELLSGPAEIYRRTYFGELVLTPDVLAELHASRTAPIRGRWHPEVHQRVETERVLRRMLGESATWSDLAALGERVRAEVDILNTHIPNVPPALREQATAMVAAATTLRESLLLSETALDSGDYEVLRQEIAGRIRPGREWSVLLRQLRSRRHPASLSATNLLADMNGAYETCICSRRHAGCMKW